MASSSESKLVSFFMLIVSGKLLLPALYRGIAYKRYHSYELSVGTNRLHAWLRIRIVLSIERPNGGVVLIRIFASGRLYLLIAIDPQAST